jgi:peptidoglycan/LPS O-acetylase OafA/YrhL
MRHLAPGRLPRLDGLRGVAILAVVFRHFGLAYPSPTTADHVIAIFFREGWCGVDLFFVLSGFLISGILIETRSASNYFTSFWARRALRIVPVYYTFLAAWFVVFPVVLPRLGVHLHLGTEHQLPYWTWTANLFGEVPQLGHLWSLSVEEQFYLVWPFAVWCLSNRRLGVLCIALVVLCPSIRVLLATAHVRPLWLWQAVARMDGLALGALVALAVRDERWRPAADRWWKPMLAVSLVGVGVIFMVFGAGETNDDWTPLLGSATSPTSSIAFSFIDIAFAAVLVGTLLSNETSPSFRLLDTTWLRTLGKYSYGLYLFHGPIAHMAMHGLPGSWLGPWLQLRSVYVAFMAASIAFSFCLAFVSWHLLEKRVLSFKDYFAARVVRKLPSTVATSAAL